MSIIEGALKRAKKADPGGERAREAASRAGTADGRGDRRQQAAVVSAVLNTYPVLQADARICEQARVVLSESDDHSDTKALDSYRIVRTRLRRALGSRDAASIGIISAGRNEGKSLTSVNLALAFARERKQNVYLLDLDLRNPSVCGMLGVAPNVEIGNYLAGAAPAETAFFTFGVEGVAIAGGTARHVNSSELLSGTALPQLFQYLHSVDPQALVLVDLPPLLPSADALIVAPHLTTTLLVVAEGVTRRDLLQRAGEMLAGVNVAGVVMNRSHEAAENYYY
ncbi:MAG TPA: CpsD/CapB family tyrosine-protein kinase [Steroidobacteraceae bacterium]